MNDIERRRLDNLVKRHRASAERDIETITALARGLNLALEPGVTLGQAERLAATALTLVRHLASLDGVQDASGVLGALEP